MDPTKTALQMYEEKDREGTVDFKIIAGSATTRNIVDLLLVIIILVLLGVSAPIIRGDHCVTF